MEVSAVPWEKQWHGRIPSPSIRLSTDSPKIFGVIRVLRLLRALRPLRVINRAPGIKLVVMTLISSLKPIGNIVLICCTFFIIFGILGVQLFKGMMFHCVGSELHNVSSKADCLLDPRNRWVRPFPMPLRILLPLPPGQPSLQL